MDAKCSRHDRRQFANPAAMSLIPLALPVPPRTRPGTSACAPAVKWQRENGKQGRRAADAGRRPRNPRRQQLQRHRKPPHIPAFPLRCEVHAPSLLPARGLGSFLFLKCEAVERGTRDMFTRRRLFPERPNAAAKEGLLWRFGDKCRSLSGSTRPVPFFSSPFT